MSGDIESASLAHIRRRYLVDAWTPEAQEGWTETDGLEPDELIALINELKRIRQAATSAINDVTRSLADTLDGNRYTDGDGSEYWVSKTRRRVPIDADTLAIWLGDDWQQVASLSSPKVTGIRAIAQARRQDPEAAVDTFLEWRYGSPRLKESHPDPTQETA